MKKHAKCNELVQNIDLAPTFLTLAGVEVPKKLPGRSLTPLFKSGKSKEWRDALYYHFYDYPAVGNVRKHYGIRTDRYKLIHWYGEGEGNEETIDFWEMYDLKKDPTEVHNVYNDSHYENIRAELTSKLKQMRKDAKVTEG